MNRFISAAVALLALVACTETVPVGYTTTTTAPFIDNASALASIAYARCDRESACNELTNYETFEACGEDLTPRAKICVIGFQAERLDKCLAGIQKVRCDTALDDIESVPECRLLCVTR